MSVWESARHHFLLPPPRGGATYRQTFSTPRELDLFHNFYHPLLSRVSFQIYPQILAHKLHGNTFITPSSTPARRRHFDVRVILPWRVRGWTFPSKKLLTNFITYCPPLPCPCATWEFFLADVSVPWGTWEEKFFLLSLSLYPASNLPHNSAVQKCRVFALSLGGSLLNERIPDRRTENKFLAKEQTFTFARAFPRRLGLQGANIV